MKMSSRSLALVGLSALLLGGSAFAQNGLGNTPPPANGRGGRTADAPTRPTPPAKGERPAGRPAAPAAGKAKVGEAAPEFSLTDSKGTAHKLSDFKGKIVVLQWINPDCPVCQRVMADGIVTTSMTESKAAASDMVWLFVNSTNYMGAEPNNAYLDRNKSTTPALVDQDGTVGRMYNARTTPHVFVIDERGILRFDGAIDDDANGANGKAGKPVMNYAVNAVKQIKAGETVSPDSTRPYGCSVKYAAAATGEGKGRESTGGESKGREGRGTTGGTTGGTGTGSGTGGRGTTR